MSPGRSHPSLVIDVQVLVTHASRVTIMEREMGHPPRIIRGPDLCDLFQARDDARLPGLGDCWESYGIMAQVVQIPPPDGPLTRDYPPTLCWGHALAGRGPSPLATGLIRTISPHMAPPTPGDMI